jgi:hypothetical protein
MKQWTLSWEILSACCHDNIHYALLSIDMELQLSVTHRLEVTAPGRHTED